MILNDELVSITQGSNVIVIPSTNI